MWDLHWDIVVFYLCVWVLYKHVNASVLGLFRWRRTCLTMKNWAQWDPRPWCKLPTCSWEISGCSGVRTSNGPSMLWRDTMQSHARYLQSHGALCLLGMQLQPFLFSALLVSFTNVSLISALLGLMWSSEEVAGFRRPLRKGTTQQGLLWALLPVHWFPL